MSYVMKSVLLEFFVARSISNHATVMAVEKEEEEKEYDKNKEDENKENEDVEKEER